MYGQKIVIKKVMVSEQTWRDLSTTIGWIYFFAWSASFYPQAWENYKRKSVAGFSLEFALLNPSGFFFYSVYSVAGFIDPFLGTGDVSCGSYRFTKLALRHSALVKYGGKSGMRDGVMASEIYFVLLSFRSSTTTWCSHSTRSLSLLCN